MPLTRRRARADHPWPPNDLTEQHGHVIREFVDKAIGSGLDVFLQIGKIHQALSLSQSLIFLLRV